MTDKTAEQTAIRRALPMNGTTAPEATKRGYGLWRGEVIHPADARMDEIAASGDPITDTKGLGLRYVSVRGQRVVPHFRVHDPEKFSAALDRMFPAVHDAVVRLVAEDIRVGGYDALARWCVGTVLPERFEVSDTVCEMRCQEDGVSYRPDISVLHSEGGRVELEVVNTHAPEARRLDAAWGAGHLVLSLRIRDLVEEIVFSEGRGIVPADDVLREMLRGRRFGLCGRERVPEAVRVVWRDLGFIDEAKRLRRDLLAARRKYEHEIIEPFFAPMQGVSLSEFDPKPAKNARMFDTYMFGIPKVRGDHFVQDMTEQNVLECLTVCYRELDIATSVSDAASVFRRAVSAACRFVSIFPNDLSRQPKRVAGAVAALRKTYVRSHRYHWRSREHLLCLLSGFFWETYLHSMSPRVLDDLTKTTESLLERHQRTGLGRFRRAASKVFFRHEEADTVAVLNALIRVKPRMSSSWRDEVNDLHDWLLDTQKKLQ